MSIDQFLLSADTTDLNYPEIRPTLDLNFARVKALDPRIDFTRASGGSYVGADGLIKYAGVNEARFDHDPETGESLGLLIEEARTNIVTNGTKLDSGFSGGGFTRKFNDEIAPDGTKTATKFIESTSSGEHLMEQFVTSLTTPGKYTHSVFIKKADSAKRIFRIRPVHVGHSSGDPTSSVEVDLDSERFVVRGEGIIERKSLIKYPNGWFRVDVTLDIDSSTTSHRFRIQILNPTGVPASFSYPGDGVSGFYVWGAQVERGSSPTSYIPTQASTRTRALDNARITGKNFSDFYNRTESSIFVEYLMKGNFGTDGFNRVLEISDGTTQNRFIILKLGSASSNTYEFFNINNISELNFATIPSNYGSFYKYTVAFKENDFVRYRIDNTNVLRSNIDSTLPLSKFFPNQLSIGYESTTNSRQLNGYIRRLTYFPKRLPNAQLQALTR